MAHVFDGSFSSTLIGAGPRDDSRFNLEVDPATNRLRATSTHVGRLTGDVTNFRIRMNETFPPIPTVSLDYDGNVCGEVIIRGQPHLIVCGVRTLNVPGPLDEKSLEAAKEHPLFRQMLEQDIFLDQVQEIWIATKP